MKLYIIDRFEGDFAVLEEDDGTCTDVKKALLPQNAREGDVLFFDGSSYFIDEAGTASRKKTIEEKMRRIFKK